jgi:AmmeMemoRadiSam system protein A
MTEADKAILLQTARESIRARLENRRPRYGQPSADLRKPFGVFVTLHIAGRLRGCIGTLEGNDPLFEAVKEMSISSAFKDPRFPPLRLDELDNIHIEISVLTPLTKVTETDEIAVGIHGLYVKKGTRSGVLLPQVAVEQGWNREEFLSNTCRKAGLPSDAWTKDEVVFFSFTAEIFGEDTGR